MKKSFLLGEFLVKNGVLTSDQIQYAVDEQKRMAYELGLMDQIELIITKEEMKRTVMRQAETGESFEQAIIALEILPPEKIEELNINLKSFRMPLGSILIKNRFVTREDLEVWLENFENQKFDDADEEKIIRLLKNIDLFASLSEHSLRSLPSLLKYQFYASGEVVYKQGVNSEYMYIVESGLVKLTVNSGVRRLELDSLQSGECFGLHGALSGTTHKEQGVAIMDTRLWLLSREDLKDLLGDNPDSAVLAATLVSENMQSIIDGVKQRSARIQTSNICTIFFDEDAYNPIFVSSMVEKLYRECSGRSLLVFSPHQDPWTEGENDEAQSVLDFRTTVLYATNPRNPKEGKSLSLLKWLDIENSENLDNLSLWINEQSEEYDSVFFVVHPRKIEFCKLLLAISWRTVTFLKNWRPDFLKSMVAGHDRAYLMDGSAAVTRARFAELRKICGECLAPITAKANDPQRISGMIARFLLGKSVGIALGGGGARGMAHIGVLQVLEEEGLEFDAVSGASAGAVKGGLYSYGYSPDEIRDMFVNDVVKKTHPFSDWTIPLYSLSRGRKIKKLLRRYVGDRLMYDALIPYFPVACNMFNADLVVMTGCEFWRGMLASSSAPGIVPMMDFNGMVLADGGLANNLPASVLKSYGTDFVISVNISIKPEKTPFRASSKIHGIIFRSIDILMNQTVGTHLEFSDLVIAPEIDQYGVLDYKNGEHIIELGRMAARQKLPELRYLLNKMR